MDHPSSLGLVLDEIRQSGPIARIHLASQVGLSTAAVSKLTAQLIEYGVVRESGYSESSAGRRPILLALNSDAYSVIGLDLNWQGLRGAIVDLEGQILAERALAWNLQEQHEVSEVAEAVASLARKLLTSRGVDRERVLGLGLVGPGPVSWPEGRMVALPLPSGARPANGDDEPRPPFDWSRVRLRQEIERLVALPVFLDNSVSAAAVAETWFGDLRGNGSLAYVAVGAGIGAGVMIDGSSDRGKRGMVAEIGHMTVDLNGPRCWCGNVGCLELYSSTGALLNQARKLALAGDAGLGALADRQECPEDLEAEDIYRHAFQGDATCGRLVDRQTAYLSTGVVNLVNMLGFRKVILGSRELSVETLAALCQVITDQIQDRTFPGLTGPVELTPSHLGGDAFTLGAATLVLSPLFTHPEQVLDR